MKIVFTALVILVMSTGFTTDMYAQSTNSLPVLATFSAGITSSKKILISWTTKQQINTDCFMVEKSTDGIGWDCIAVVNSTGSSTIPVTYTQLDAFPLKGSNFYRIGFKTQNGEIGYTPTKNVRLDVPVKTTIYPNPSVNMVNIVLGHVPVTDWNVYLISSSGQVMAQKKYNRMLSAVSLPVDGYPTGEYILEIIDGNSRQSNKLMINHY